MSASFPSLARILKAAVLVVATVAQAAPRAVESFDERTWQALRTSLGASAVVVFTTTDCAYCPGVIEQLARDIRQRKLKASLVAMVMDMTPGEADAALMREPHYSAADRLLAFSGPAAALRHTVNPSWRGVTPYVAFLRPGGTITWVTGPPSAQVVAAWAAEVKNAQNGR